MWQGNSTIGRASLPSKRQKKPSKPSFRKWVRWSGSHPVPEELRDGALDLDKAYIPARYSNAHPSGSPRRRYTRKEAERMVIHAEQIVQFCESLLSALQS